MAQAVPQVLREAVAEKLADALASPFPEATPRRVYGAIGLPGKATAVVGMRRSGKTTFLHQLRRQRMGDGANREHVPFLNFEDERLAGLSAAHLGFVVEEYARRFPRAASEGTITWCFDAIQVVNGWERFVRRLLDARFDVIVTGSSAALLSREIATSLKGPSVGLSRHVFNLLRPFDSNCYK